MSLSLLVRVSPLWTPLPVLSFVLSAIARPLLVIGHAVAKASVMRLLGVPRLPLPLIIPSYALARNRPGPADSFFCSKKNISPRL
jgi:hypothetical protein